MPTEPALMEEIKRTNTEMVLLSQQAEVISQNLYVMNVDRERNCYSYGGFGHLV